MNCSPVVLIIFNRPDLTKIIFQQIKNIKPTKLFIIADGPRADRKGETQLCAETRELVENIDWECDVQRNYSEVNLGCKKRISSGLDWVFSLTEEAIILEDDCLADPSFFRYCTELLEYYRDDKRIGTIGGSNFYDTKPPNNESYYFSKYPLIWGWATWRRVWENYDVDINDWPKLRNQECFKNSFYENEIKHWNLKFDAVHDNKIDTWDYQFFFHVFKNKYLNIQPNVNLISNLGFREDATHTHYSHELSDLQTFKIDFPLQHASIFEENQVNDVQYRKKTTYRRKRRIDRMREFLRL